MSYSTTSRRRFIVGLISLSGTTASMSVFQSIGAWAQDSDGHSLDPGVVRLARLLYPHDALPDNVYAEVLGDALFAMTADDTFGLLLDDVGAALDLHAGSDFVKAGQADQIAAMRAVESEPAFTIIQKAVRDGIYRHPACWEVIGYGGPSFQDGGYLHRGVGEIDWLPENE
jgi:hypothetical protein